jgi:glucose 1-dehydrogenase
MAKDSAHMERLKGKNVLITGASSGIGQAVAIRFAKEGANVAINFFRGADGAEETRKQAEASRAGEGKQITLQADVSDETQVKAMFEKFIAEFGSIDV